VIQKTVLLLLVPLLLASCTLFSPITRDQAGAVANREIDPRRSELDDLATRNQALRKSQDADIMVAPARDGGGIVGEIDVEKVVSPPSAAAIRGKGKAFAIRLEFSDTSLKDIVVVFMQEYLKQPYSFQDSFKDKPVNLYFNAKATREEMIRLFDTLLENYGVRLRYSGGVYLVGAMDDKALPAFQPSPLGIGEAVGVFRPNFIEGKDFQQLAKQVVKQADRIVALPGNIVLVNSSSTDVRAAASLLQEVDVPAFGNKKILVYIPRYLSAPSLVAVLDTYQMQLTGGQAGSKQFEAKQIPESEKVVIVAASKLARDLVVQFLAQTDVAGGNQRRVYQYALGTQLAVELTVNLNTLIKAVFKNQAEVAVVPDKVSNSLFIYATPDEFAEIRKLLARMDYRPPSVQIDVVIAEVNLSKNMRYGVEWYLKSTGRWLSDITTNMGIPKALTDAGGSFVAGIVSPGNNYATLQLLGSETSFSLLSSPKIVVKNGATAKISVGQEQPIIKSKSINNSSTAANTVVEPEFKKIGLELEVTPFVTQANEVRMTIKVKDTSIIGSQTLGSDSYPILANREISTDLVTGDGKTVFLGGIRKQQTNDTGSKIPGLGDVQYLGALFRNKAMDDVGQELIILATPTIMFDQQGADVLTQALLNAARREFTDPRIEGKPQRQVSIVPIEAESIQPSITGDR
jgi:general secretion pathway protein D